MRYLLTAFIFPLICRIIYTSNEYEKLIVGLFKVLNTNERYYIENYQKYFDNDALVYVKRMNFDLVKKGTNEIKHGFLEILGEFVYFEVKIIEIFKKNKNLLSEVELKGKLKNGEMLDFRCMFKFVLKLSKIQLLKIFLDIGSFMRVSCKIDLWRY
jgi:hypothetical protein